jgi:hypothetical protein
MPLKKTQLQALKPSVEEQRARARQWANANIIISTPSPRRKFAYREEWEFTSRSSDEEDDAATAAAAAADDDDDDDDDDVMEEFRVTQISPSDVRMVPSFDEQRANAQQWADSHLPPSSTIDTEELMEEFNTEEIIRYKYVAISNNTLSTLQ